MIRARGHVEAGHGKRHAFLESDEGALGDLWVYGDLRWPLTPSYAAVGIDRDDLDYRPLTYDDIRPGCFDQKHRLVDMDLNHVEAALCFPSFPRFCGQTFLEQGDRDLSLACVVAYNDWMIEEWCGDAGRGRLIPLTLIPLWDVDLAAAEVRRCAAKGSHAVAFSEGPTALGLSSIHSGYWDPLFQACEDTQTVVNLHIGSSSRMATTGPDSPQMVSISLTFQGALHGAVDLLLSGIFERFGSLRVALSEGQGGWLPFLVERMDKAWDSARARGGVADLVPRPPSTYIAGHLYTCIFDDLTALREREVIGMSQILFETDYPHSDTTWPDSRAIVQKLCTDAGLSSHEAVALVRGNAIECYGLDRFGIRV